MGIPEHYSRDIAQRCQTLIRHLRPVVEKGLPDDGEFGGPLGTTFLLAMATPMIVLPIERIFKPAQRGAAASGDDREIDPALAAEVDDVLGPTRRFADAPFVTPRSWSYIQNYQPFKLADYWPVDLLDVLSSQAAFTAADQAPADRILRDLRNALAHGGIAYLNAHGQCTDGQAEMFGFASAIIQRGKVTRINVLRTHQDNFCNFLLEWAHWLAASPIRNSLNERDALAA